MIEMDPPEGSCVEAEGKKVSRCCIAKHGVDWFSRLYVS